MVIPIEVEELTNVVMIGDRVLIKPKAERSQTDSGLYLPPGVREKETIQVGYVMKVGPGYPIPALADEESWKEPSEEIKYVPLQPKEGDLAVYLQKSAHEIRLHQEPYMIVPHQAILMIIRDNGLFE